MEVYDKIADLALLWRRAGEIFPRFADVACNWEEAFYQFLPRLMRADDRQTHLLFAEFLNLLGDGHTDYQFPRAFLREYGFAPFSLGFCADAYFLNGVSPEYGAFLGAAVETLDGRPFPEILNEAAKYSYHVGAFLPEYRLNALLPLLLLRGQTHEMITSKGSFSFRLLPERPELLLARKGRAFEIRQLGNGILYVNLPDFLHADTAAKVRAALDETTPDGLILDIRDNIGGMTLFGARVAELLISGAFSGCRKQTRIMEGVDLAGASQILLESPEEQAREIAAGLYTRAQMEDARKRMAGTYTRSYLDHFGKEGQQALFSGPCAVLTSRRTVSAAEDFLAMLRSNHRAAVIGAPTCGTTGTPMLLKLRCGGSARICSVGYQMLDGTAFLGLGIRPDIPIEPTPEDILTGKDPVLDAAVSQLAGNS